MFALGVNPANISSKQGREYKRYKFTTIGKQTCCLVSGGITISVDYITLLGLARLSGCKDEFAKLMPKAFSRLALNVLPSGSVGISDNTYSPLQFMFA